MPDPLKNAVGARGRTAKQGKNVSNRWRGKMMCPLSRRQVKQAANRGDPCG